MTDDKPYKITNQSEYAEPYACVIMFKNIYNGKRFFKVFLSETEIEISSDWRIEQVLPMER